MFVLGWIRPRLGLVLLLTVLLLAAADIQSLNAPPPEPASAPAPGFTNP